MLVSSHVLHEVESLTRNVILLYQGRVRAHGTMDEIRAVLHRYPHRIRLHSARARDLARAILALEPVVGTRIVDETVEVETFDLDQLYDRLPAFVLDEGLPITGIETTDATLDAIFEYLVS